MMVGDGTLAGDMGFDPLQLADSPDKLAFYREAEVKHARLAMLAAFGWPVSEITNFGGLLNGDGRAPSLLNGGLGNVNGVYWGAVVALAVYWEKFGLDQQFGSKDVSKSPDYLPGMLGFDPLGADSQGMRAAEITNGRVAMMAIVQPQVCMVKFCARCPTLVAVVAWSVELLLAVALVAALVAVVWFLLWWRLVSSVPPRSSASTALAALFLPFWHSAQPVVVGATMPA